MVGLSANLTRLHTYIHTQAIVLYVVECASVAVLMIEHLMVVVEEIELDGEFQEYKGVVVVWDVWFTC